jgi:hypothetical protein
MRKVKGALKHVDVAAQKVYQDAREVSTKYSKSFTTFFFPVADEISQDRHRLGELPAPRQTMEKQRSAVPSYRDHRRT